MKKVYYYWNNNGQDGITTDLALAKCQEEYELAKLTDLYAFASEGITIEGMIQVQEGCFIYCIDEDEEISEYLEITYPSVASF